jgi:hypothetical protein
MPSAGAKAVTLPYSFTMAQIDRVKGETESEGVFFRVPGVAVVTWDPEHGAVCIEWQSWASSAEFVAALDAGLLCLTEHRGSRFLADCTAMKAVKQFDQEWLDQDWFPRVLALGLRRMAVVTPKSGLVRMNVKDMMARVPATKLEVAHFATVAEAKEWLHTGIKTPAALTARST